MAGGHGHGGGHGHVHLTASSAERGRLRLVLAVTVGVLLAELVGGLAAHSLVLLADAGHLLADAAGIGLALLAVSFATRPATSARTFGLQRAEVLAAVANAALLLSVGLTVLVTGVLRLAHPGRSEPRTMAVLGVVALAANGLCVLLLSRGAAGSLPVRGAYLEVLADALGAAGVLVAAGIIATTGWQQADPVASIAIALLIVPRTVRLLREAVDVLLEATPRGVDLAEVRAHIESIAGVDSCHDLHAWTITSGSPVLSAHVVVADELWRDGSAPVVLDRLGECLAGHFDVEHSTFQLEAPGHDAHEAALHP